MGDACCWAGLEPHADRPAWPAQWSLVQACCTLIQSIGTVSCVKHHPVLSLGPDLPAPSGTGWNRGFYSVLLGRVGIFRCFLLIRHLFYPELFPRCERGASSTFPPGAGGDGGGQTRRVSLPGAALGGPGSILGTRGRGMMILDPRAAVSWLPNFWRHLNGEMLAVFGLSSPLSIPPRCTGWEEEE